MTGVRTMKMIRSTRTTSTNGVTLISDRIEPLPPTCMGLGSLSRGFLRLRDQADVVEADLAAGLEDVEHVPVFHETIALDRDLAIGRPFVNLLERRLHLVLANDVRTEIDRAVRLDRDLELLLGV